MDFSKSGAQGDGRRVLWVTNLAPPYRVPVWSALGRTYELDVYLFAAKYNVAWSGQSYSKQSTVTEYHLRSARVFFRGSGIYFPLAVPMAALFRANVLVIGNWEAPISLLLIPLAKLFRKRIVIFYESIAASGTNKRIRRLKSAVLRSADAVVTPGASATKSVLEMGVHRSKIEQSFNAVDVSGIHSRADEARAKVRNDKIRDFLYLGQLIDRKNVGTLIDQLAEVGADASLTICGAGPLLGALQEKVGQLPDQDVRFISHVDYVDVPKMLALHRVLVLPSTREVWGLVVNEALAAGLRVVVSSSSGVAASVEGMRGVFIWNGSEPALGEIMAQALKSALSEGPILRPDILEFTPEAMAADFARAIGGQG